MTDDTTGIETFVRHVAEAFSATGLKPCRSCFFSPNYDGMGHAACALGALAIHGHHIGAPPISPQSSNGEAVEAHIAKHVISYYRDIDFRLGIEDGWDGISERRPEGRMRKLGRQYGEAAWQAMCAIHRVSHTTEKGAS